MWKRVLSPAIYASLANKRPEQAGQREVGVAAFQGMILDRLGIIRLARKMGNIWASIVVSWPCSYMFVLFAG